MTRRKLTATNLEYGSDREYIYSEKTVRFCPKCHAHGHRPHYPGCDGEWVRISANAQMPKRTVKNKVWEWFIRKFVNREFYEKFIQKKVYELYPDNKYYKHENEVNKILKSK